MGGGDLPTRINSPGPKPQLPEPRDCSQYTAVHTPAKHPQAIYHGGVRVSANHAVWIVVAILIHHHSCQVLQVHLVDDPRAWRNNPQVFKSLRAPLKQKELK